MFALTKMIFSEKRQITDESLICRWCHQLMHQSVVIHIPGLTSHITHIAWNPKRLAEDLLVLTTEQQKWQVWWRGRRWKWSSRRIRWLTAPLGGRWWAARRDQQETWKPWMKSRHSEGGILKSTLRNRNLPVMDWKTTVVSQLLSIVQ